MEEMDAMEEAQLLTIVTHIVEQHGCRLVDFDPDNQIINVEGPEEAKTQCAMALASVLG